MSRLIIAGLLGGILSFVVSCACFGLIGLVLIITGADTAAAPAIESPAEPSSNLDLGSIDIAAEQLSPESEQAAVAIFMLEAVIDELQNQINERIAAGQGDTPADGPVIATLSAYHVVNEGLSAATAADTLTPVVQDAQAVSNRVSQTSARWINNEINTSGAQTEITAAQQDLAQIIGRLETVLTNQYGFTLDEIRQIRQVAQTTLQASSVP